MKIPQPPASAPALPIHQHSPIDKYVTLYVSGLKKKEERSRAHQIKFFYTDECISDEHFALKAVNWIRDNMVEVNYEKRIHFSSFEITTTKDHQEFTVKDITDLVFVKPDPDELRMKILNEDMERILHFIKNAQEPISRSRVNAHFAEEKFPITIDRMKLAIDLLCFQGLRGQKIKLIDLKNSLSNEKGLVVTDV